MSVSDKHSLRSSEREEYIEYIFLGELCSFGWNNDRFVEVARAQTDAFGYDLVLSSGGVTRHVQLKASKADGKTDFQKISLSLGEKQSGCVVWIKVNADTLHAVEYGWLGGSPNEKLVDLGEKPAKHTKGDATGEKKIRTNLREMKWNKFEKLKTTQQIFDALFGPERMKGL